MSAVVAEGRDSLREPTRSLQVGVAATKVAITLRVM